MSPDQERLDLELAELAKMFESPGWGIFVREQEQSLAAVKAHGWDRVKTLQDFHELKGWIDAMTAIVHYENRFSPPPAEDTDA